MRCTRELVRDASVPPGSWSGGGHRRARSRGGRPVRPRPPSPGSPSDLFWQRLIDPAPRPSPCSSSSAWPGGTARAPRASPPVSPLGPGAPASTAWPAVLPVPGRRTEETPRVCTLLRTLSRSLEGFFQDAPGYYAASPERSCRRPLCGVRRKAFPSPHRTAPAVAPPEYRVPPTPRSSPDPRGHPPSAPSAPVSEP